MGQEISSDNRMIVRVANAIAKSLGDTSWENHINTARAAVSALRQPTDDMLDAALHDMPDWGYLPEDWEAMIDYVMHEPVDQKNPGSLNS